MLTLLYLHENYHILSEVVHLLQDHVAERVLLVSPEKLDFLGTLVPRVSLGPKALRELRDLKDRLGRLETREHKVNLDK